MKKFIAALSLIVLLVAIVAGAFYFFYFKEPQTGLARFKPMWLHNIGLIDGKGQNVNIEFINQELIYYTFPINPPTGKTVYTEGIRIYKGDYFILSQCTARKLNCNTRVLKYSDIDTVNKKILFSDLGLEEIQTSYSENKGLIDIGGEKYNFEVREDNGLNIDLNGDKKITEGRTVSIGVKKERGIIDLGPQNMKTGESKAEIGFYAFY